MRALRQVVEDGCRELHIPGAAVGVLTPDGVECVTTGVTDHRHPLAVDGTTIFQIGSISKTFCGTAAMQLGLDLDAPLSTYVPNLRLPAEGVTLRHVFTHTTGWVGDYFKDTGQGDDALAAFVAKLAKAPQLTPVGTTYSYNNSAFNVAAHAIATVNGTSYEQAVRDLVFEPLGLRHTFYATDDVIGHRIAIGHRDGRPQRWTRPRAHNGNGGVLSCLDDLLTYARFHLENDVGGMHDTQRAAGSLCDETAIVWFVDTHAGNRVVHHGGTTNGYQADLRLVHERGVAWAMLTNADHHHQLDRMIREHLLGPDEVALDHRPGDLDEYAGRYVAVLSEIEVGREGDGLVARIGVPERAKWRPDDPTEPPVPTRLAFRDADRVQALDMPFLAQRGEFVRDADGTVAFFRWDGRIAARR